MIVHDPHPEINNPPDALSIDPSWPDADAQQREWNTLCHATPWLAGYLNRHGHARQPSRDDLRAAILWLMCDASFRDAFSALACGQAKYGCVGGRS